MDPILNPETLRLGVVLGQAAALRAEPRPTELLTPTVDGTKVVWSVPGQHSVVAIATPGGTVLEWLRHPEWFPDAGTYSVDLRDAFQA